MTTKTKEKKLLYIDQSMARSLEKVHRKGHRILNELTGLYNQLSIGNITRNRLDEILDKNFSGIEADIWGTANSDLKKFKTQFITDALRTETQQRINEFKEKASKLVSRFVEARFYGANDYPLVHENFSIRAGKIELSPENMERLINEHCAVFIETEQQAEFWEMLQQAQKICNQCKQFLQENEISIPLFYQHYQAPGFMVENPDGITLNPKEMRF